MEDSAIIELYWKRDENAISESDRKYGAYCSAVAVNILSDRQECEECVNDTWLRAWNTMPPCRPNCLKLFFAKITRNLSFNRYRAKKAQKRGGGEIGVILGELDECVRGNTDVEGEAEAKELTGIIERFLDTVSSRDREIFLRRYFYSETVESIARHCAVKESNVLMILSRTRKKLREHLEKEGYGV